MVNYMEFRLIRNDSELIIGFYYFSVLKQCLNDKKMAILGWTRGLTSKRITTGRSKKACFYRGLNRGT